MQIQSRVRAFAILVVGLALLTSLGTGCTHRLTQSEIRFLETRELDASYEEVYGAAMNAIFSMGMTINHSDKASGVISGQSGDHALRASQRSKKKFLVKKVTLLITPRNRKNTLVRMKVLINEQQQLDRKLMTEIWQRIEREAVLSAPANQRYSRAKAQPSGPRRRSTNHR